MRNIEVTETELHNWILESKKVKLEKGEYFGEFTRRFSAYPENVYYIEVKTVYTGPQIVERI